MQPFIPKKESSTNFTNPAVQQAFVQDTQNSKALLQKELDVNQAEQGLLQKRLQLMKEFLNELPSNDPQYSMTAIQIQMDQLEMDELKTREIWLIQKIGESGSGL